MSDNDLFAKEEEVLAAAELQLKHLQPTQGNTQQLFGLLVVEYRKLLKTQRRLMRLSDRNERLLNEMAEEQRKASEEISRKNSQLETLSGKLAKYLSPQVYSSIFTGKQEVKLASRRRKLTVFFSDIAGFTELTDKMESEDLTRLLNQYLTEMSHLALEHGATIDKYVGDAIMIFFGDPETRGIREDALACVKMAIAMQDRIRVLREEWANQGISDELTCRMGINTGFCTVGNFGSEDRMDYTIIGGAVNIASRLESEADSGDILISYETYANVRNEISCEELGPIQVKGVAYPVAVYRVVGIADNSKPEHRDLSADLPNLHLKLESEKMSLQERRDAADHLRKVIKALDVD